VNIDPFNALEMSTAVGPRWLVDAFTTRGGRAPVLLRDVDAAVWTDGSFVAKLHDDPGQARREQNVAKRFSDAGCRVAPPLGTQHAETGGGMSWWAYVGIDGPATACEAARWLRTAHDTASAQRISRARLGSPARAAHPDAAELHDALAPWRQRAREAQAALEWLPQVLIHGDANPTNIVRSDGAVLALDFGAAGAGPRVVDVATVAVLAVETRVSSPGEVVAAYGPHPDITPELMPVAELIVAVARAQACTWVPWLDEGWDRLDALRATRPYVFGAGNHPK
jgi:hypothetical protein